MISAIFIASSEPSGAKLIIMYGKNHAKVNPAPADTPKIMLSHTEVNSKNLKPWVGAL